MADFIAVIRRAVDGLTDNTPDMRVKVYERARGAVQRQLENMKPRPPEAMLQRQLEKLEAAIREVEAEHASALPAEDEADGAAAAPIEQVVAEARVPAPPEPVAEPVAEVSAVEPVDEPQAYEEPRYEEPVEAGSSGRCCARRASSPVVDEEPAAYHAPEPEPFHEP
jgi:type II secretory pathway component HofQ